eukprot:Rhum_TRINITY_DN3482_c0_g1::Rhum_TRINITY_DN3482_c0_g1_i1::g.10924::m.10924
MSAIQGSDDGAAAAAPEPSKRADRRKRMVKRKDPAQAASSRVEETDDGDDGDVDGDSFDEPPTACGSDRSPALHPQVDPSHDRERGRHTPISTSSSGDDRGPMHVGAGHDESSNASASPQMHARSATSSHGTPLDSCVAEDDTRLPATSSILKKGTPRVSFRDIEAEDTVVIEGAVPEAAAVASAAVPSVDRELYLKSRGMTGRVAKKTKQPLTTDRAETPMMGQSPHQAAAPVDTLPSVESLSARISNEAPASQARAGVQHMSKRTQNRKITSHKVALPAAALPVAKTPPVLEAVETRILDKEDAHRVLCVSCTAQSYDMEALKSVFMRAFPSSTFVSHDTQLESEVAHILLPTSDWNSDADVFVFAYGSVAYWGPNEKSLWADVVSTLVHASNEKISNYDCEVLTWGYNKPYETSFATSASESDYRSIDESSKAKYKYSWVDQDHVYLASTDADIKLAFSHAVAQSEKLSHYEDRIDEQIVSTRKYPEELASSGEVTMTGKAIARTKGQLFLHRMNIILHTDLLDTPDFFWERTDLEPLYIHARKYFEISRRVKVLNERLGVVAELFDMLHEQQKQKHSDKLEWIVIWLIAVEIIVSALTIFLKVFPAVLPDR